MDESIVKGIYRLAELNIEIYSLYDHVHRLCADYVTDDDNIDIYVKTNQEDIDFERERSENEDRAEENEVRHFSNGYLETLAVYRKIAEKVPDYDGLLFHGSCVAVDGEGYLFTAKSGTGKSTHTQLWMKLFGERAVIVNDDKPLIRIKNGNVLIYGTPWDGKHRLSSNIAVPLKAICILERAIDNNIKTVNIHEAYPMLLQQAYRPMSMDSMKKTVGIVDKLAESVSLWRLGCNMDIEAAEIAYKAMEGKTNEVK